MLYKKMNYLAYLLYRRYTKEGFFCDFKIFLPKVRFSPFLSDKWMKDKNERMISMKKALILFTILALTLTACNVPGSNAPPTSTTPTGTTEVLHNIVEYDEMTAPPSDEEETSVTYDVSSPDGLALSVTLFGYKSNMQGESLYFKNNEPIEIKVIVTNKTDTPIYQWQPTMCHGLNPPHEHELSVSFSDANGNKLTSANLDLLYSAGCPEAIEIWSLAPGESYEWDLRYFAGTVKQSAIWKDPICDTEFSANFDLYDEDIFTDGVCEFNGSIDFDFRYTADDDEYGNPETLSIPLSLKVFYVGE